MVYDIGGDLYIRNTNGVGVPANLTGGSATPCNGSNICEDVDAGPRINSAGDFLIVFTRETTEGTTGDLFLATVDVSENELTNIHAVADDSLINYHPAWCGSHHVVWSHDIPCGTPCGAGLYWWEICIVAVDPDEGATEPPTCFFGDETHLKANQHPSCNPTGDMVAIARSDGDTKSGNFYVEGTHKICTFDLLADVPEDTLLCLPGDSDEDDNHPVWSQAGDEIAFDSERPVNGTSDREIWSVLSDNIDEQTPDSLTDNTDPDIDPDWGP